MDSNLGDKHSPDDTEPKAFTPTNTLDIKAEKELEQFAESNERYRSQILKQKQEYQKMLPIGVAFIAAFFYIFALALAYKILCWVTAYKIEAQPQHVFDIPKGVIAFLVVLCSTPTILVIVMLKSLFSINDKEMENPSAIAEIAKEGLDNIK